MGDPTIHVVTTDVTGAAEASSNVTAPKTEIIRNDIEHTRAEMSVTIDAIQRKLDPEVLKEKAHERIEAAKEQVKERVAEAKEQVKERVAEAKEHVKDEVREHIAGAKHAVHDATIGRVQHMVHRAGHDVREARTTVVDTIRANPIPAAMVATGLAWLFFGGRKQMETRRGYSTPRYLEDDYDVYGDYEFGTVGNSTPREGRFERATHRVQDAAMNARDIASTTAHDVRDGAAELAHRTRDEAVEFANRARREAREFGSRARHEARAFGSRARREAMRAERSVERTYQQNPIGLGLAALALGSLIGAALPRTRREDELVGKTRDKLLSRARDVAEEAVERVKETADEKLNTFGNQRPSLA